MNRTIAFHWLSRPLSDLDSGEEAEESSNEENENLEWYKKELGEEPDEGISCAMNELQSLFCFRIFFLF